MCKRPCPHLARPHVPARSLTHGPRSEYPRPAALLLWIMAEVAIIGSDVQEVIGSAMWVAAREGGQGSGRPDHARPASAALPCHPHPHPLTRTIPALTTLTTPSHDTLPSLPCLHCSRPPSTPPSLPFHPGPTPPSQRALTAVWGLSAAVGGGAALCGCLLHPAAGGAGGWDSCWDDGVVGRGA